MVMFGREWRDDEYLSWNKGMGDELANGFGLRKGENGRFGRREFRQNRNVTCFSA